MTPKEVLKYFWGYNDFRQPQEDIIYSVLNRKDTLAILPTSGGKSLCYQIPGIMLEGVTLVISPLIALMKDQVNTLKSNRIPAELISSEYSQTRIMQIIERTKQGKVKLLYVSPERLQSNLFIEHLQNINLNLIAIDEAHCISEWGHDFRPAYHKISKIKNYFPNIPILALTATATNQIKDEIISKLELFEPNVFKSTLNRDNLSYHVIESHDKLGDLIKYLRVFKGSAIIFVRNRKQTQEIAEFLLKNSIDANYFHAKLSKEEKETRQKNWTESDNQVMVATNAFGMGIDKSNVRTVFHVDLPPSIESYYQEVGRAGRDGKKSRGIYLYHKDDQLNAENIFKANLPSKTEFLRITNALFSHLIIGEGELYDLDYSLDIPKFSEEFKFNPKTVFMFLDFLNTQGVIYLKNFSQQSTVHVNASPRAIQTINKPLLDYLQRNYSGIYNSPREINEYKIAFDLESSISTIRDELHRLKNNQILTYSDRYLARFRFLIPRENNLFQNKLWNIFENIQVTQWKRLQAISYYSSQDKDCREQLIFSYFNQKSTHKCGKCDICIKNKNLNNIPQLIVEYIGNETKSLDEILTKFITSPKVEILQILQKLIDDFTIEIEGLNRYKIKK